MELTIGHLYPAEMNLYGDRGNILCLTQRGRWRGIEVRVRPIGLGEPWPLGLDLLFFGGGPDAQQKGVARDLLDVKGEALRRDLEGGLVALAICGGFQLLCRYYRPAEGPDLPGLGFFDAWTVHPGPRVPRCIGNVVVEWEGAALVGFENHGGRTYLGPGCRPLGRVRRGHGNNGQDKTEGAICRSAYASYLHGPLLPRNPRLADHLLRLALERRYGPADDPQKVARLSGDPSVPLAHHGGSPGKSARFAWGYLDLPLLDDALESLAHGAALRRAGVG